MDINEKLLASCEVYGGCIEEVQKYIAQGADINTKDKWGHTPLINATRWGHIKVAEYLIEQGADVNAKDIWNRTALDHLLELQELSKAKKDRSDEYYRDTRAKAVKNQINPLKKLLKQKMQIKPKAKAKSKSNDFGMNM